MLWDEFKELVYKKYSPKSLIEKMEEEFRNLSQGVMCVQEYTTKFMEKARFAGVRFRANETKMMIEFVSGLEIEIQCLVAMTKPKTFEEAVERALIAEKDCGMQKVKREKTKRQCDGWQEKSKKTRTWTE